MKDNNDIPYFSFVLGEGMFSVPVTNVREVFNYESLTPIPNSLKYLKGVMNIRGSVVSIIDLRDLFGFNPPDDIEGCQIIYLEIPQANEKPFEFAIIADKVDVVSQLKMIPADSVSFAMLKEQRQFVKSIARQGDMFILVLDLEKIIEYIEKDVEEAGAAGF